MFLMRIKKFLETCYEYLASEVNIKKIFLYKNLIKKN